MLIKTELEPNMKTEGAKQGVGEAHDARLWHSNPGTLPQEAMFALDCIWAQKCQHEEQQTQWPLTRRWLTWVQSRDEDQKKGSKVSGEHLFLDCLCKSLQKPGICILSQIVWSKCHALKQQRGQISQTSTEHFVHRDVTRYRLAVYLQYNGMSIYW